MPAGVRAFPRHTSDPRAAVLPEFLRDHGRLVAESAAMALSTGTRIGAYETTGPLGAGGMGEVYRARDARLKREVALKILRASVAADPDRLLKN